MRNSSDLLNNFQEFLKVYLKIIEFEKNFSKTFRVGNIQLALNLLHSAFSENIINSFLVCFSPV